MSAPARLPITVLTGFLGSGKTTLLKALLTAPECHDAAVLVNELGEIGIDHHLLETLDERTVVLDSGCVCCSIREDLGTAARGLFLKRARGAVPPFRRLFIETTGLADPVPILHTLMTEPVVKEAFILDGIITTVDALNAERHFANQPEAVKQASVADRIVITKTDLADPAAVAALDTRLERLNPSARRVHAPGTALVPTLLEEDAPYDPAARPAQVRAWLNAEAYAAAQSASSHRHDHRIKAFCLRFETPIDWNAFAFWLTLMLHRHGENVLRVKGLLDIGDGGGPVVIHGVQHVVHTPVHLARWPDGGSCASELVFICRDIERHALEASLRMFLRLPACVEVNAGTAGHALRAFGGTRIGGRATRRPSAPAWMK